MRIRLYWHTRTRGRTHTSLTHFLLLAPLIARYTLSMHTQKLELGPSQCHHGDGRTHDCNKGCVPRTCTPRHATLPPRDAAICCISGHTSNAAFLHMLHFWPHSTSGSLDMHGSCFSCARVCPNVHCAQQQMRSRLRFHGRAPHPGQPDCICCRVWPSRALWAAGSSAGLCAVSRQIPC
jgi:hypothetical protein